MPTDDYIKRSDAINALTVSALLRNLDSVEDGPAHMYKRAAERIIASVPAADVEPKRRWIPVTDPEIPLPEPYKRVMVFSKFTGQNTDWIGDNGDWFRTPFVTHWKPLGEPPKEKDDEE